MARTDEPIKKLLKNTISPNNNIKNFIKEDKSRIHSKDS